MGGTQGGLRGSANLASWHLVEGLLFYSLYSILSNGVNPTMHAARTCYTYELERRPFRIDIYTYILTLDRKVRSF